MESAPTTEMGKKMVLENCVLFIAGSPDIVRVFLGSS
jgi:hypothetical protein